MKTYKVTKTVTITYTRMIQAHSARQAEEVARDYGVVNANDSTTETEWHAKLAAPMPDKIRVTITRQEV